MPGYRFTRRLPAPVDDVWALLVDHAGYRSWTPVTTSRLVEAGVGDPNGVGAVRRLGAGPVGTTERVLEFDPPRHFAYTIVAGLPVDDYRADVTLEPAGDDTVLTYEGTVTGRVPGTSWLLARFTELAVRTLVAALARELRRR